MAKEYQKEVKTRSTSGWGRDTPFIDDFNRSNVNWIQQILGAGTITIDTSQGYRSDNSMKIVTGAVSGDYNLADKFFGAVKREKIKISVFPVMNPPALSKLDITVPLSIERENKQVTVAVRIVTAADESMTIFVSEDGGFNYTQIATGINWWFNYGFAEIAIYVDLLTKKYEKIEIANYGFDISAYSLKENTISDSNPSGIMLIGYNGEAVAKTFNIGYVSVDYQ